MDLSKLMKQAQQMQKDLANVEKELKEKTYEGSASSGAIKCVVNGENNLISLEIEDDLLSKDNKEMLQDLIKIAVNEAIVKATKERETKMNSLTSGVKIPGIF